MKKYLSYILVAVISFILFFSLGLFVGKNVFKEEKQKVNEVEKESVNDSENSFVEGFYLTNVASVDDFYVIGGTVHAEDAMQYMYVVDEFGQEKMMLKNANLLTKVMIGDKEAYQVDIELSRGGEHSTTYILNEDLDVIVKTADLPEQFEGMDKDLFTPHYNSNGTISVMINDIYVYDYNGKLIKTIKTDNNVIELQKDYYLVKDNGKYKFLRYDNEFELLIEDNKNMNLVVYPVAGSSGIVFENGKLELSLVDKEDDENPVCYDYVFYDKNQKLTLAKKEKVECEPWV